MPKFESRLSIITIASRDMARSAKFYEDLGFDRAGGSEDQMLFYQMNGFIFGVYGADHLTEDAGMDSLGVPNHFGGIALAYNVRSKDEVDGLLRFAESCGARITRPASDQFWGGYSGYFADPDGHSWEVAWNPHSPLDEDGNLFMK